MSLRIIRPLPVLVAFLAAFSSTALADGNLQTRLQKVVDDYHAVNPEAPGVVVDLGVGYGEGYLFGEPEIMGQDEPHPADQPPTETLDATGTDDAISRPDHQPPTPPAAEPRSA